MAISYPITMPASTTICPAAITFRGRANVAVTSSPFTGVQQVHKQQGQWWECELQYPPMTRTQAEALITFKSKLNGRYGTFLLNDQSSTRMGSGLGAPAVVGSTNTGTDLTTNGWTANSTGVLLAGDWISIGSSLSTRLYKVLDTVSATSDGTATITVFPDVRAGTTDGTTIRTSTAKGVFRLVLNDMEFNVGEAKIYGVTLAAVEAL